MNAEELRDIARNYNKGITYVQDIMKACKIAAQNGEYIYTHQIVMAHYPALLKYCNERDIIITIISGKEGDAHRSCNISWND